MNRTQGDFAALAESHRRELRLHCYRMLGSLDEAEDAVQDAFLRAWRAFQEFDGRAPRAWLHRIATNACLDMIAARKRSERLLPDQVAPPTRIMPADAGPSDIPWLEPYPDSEIDDLADSAPNPEARYSARESVRLAFVAAIQRLPARQRAAVLLCDVLGWSAEEAARILESSIASVNSALQRARATLEKPSAPHSETTAAQRSLLDRYVRAWEAHDVAAFVAVLKSDATCVMPPWPQWFADRDSIGAFFSVAWKGCLGLRFVPTAANGQPAFALYERDAEGRWVANAIHVLSLDDAGIARVVIFLDPGGKRIFVRFGLSAVLSADDGGRPPRS